MSHCVFNKRRSTQVTLANIYRPECLFSTEKRGWDFFWHDSAPLRPPRRKEKKINDKAKAWSCLSSGQTFHFWREATVPGQSILMSVTENWVKPIIIELTRSFSLLLTMKHCLQVTIKAQAYNCTSVHYKNSYCDKAKIGQQLVMEEVFRSFAEVKLPKPHYKWIILH